MIIPPFNPENFQILIVDDIPQTIKLLATILENKGYKTLFAQNSQQTVEKAKLSHPDLILLDLMMPEINGLEICRTLKADETLRDIPIIFLTASTDDQHLLEAFAEGAVDYITKPFKTPELLARVRIHLDLKRTQDELKKAYREMEKLATTDPLTMVANRHSILTLGEREFFRSQRYYSCFSIIMLDVDSFKAINDTYGHEMGDIVLRQIVHTLSKNIRPFDQVGRLGGEEFLIILTETSLEMALNIAERLRQAVAGLIIQQEDTLLKVTVSMGVDCYQDYDQSLEQIIQRADQALLVAKRNGRNQIFSLSSILI